MQLIERHEHAKGEKQDPSRLFQFNVEDRLQCTSSMQVRYSHAEQNMLSVPIPLDMAVNKAEVAAYEATQSGKSAEQKQQELLCVLSGTFPLYCHAADLPILFNSAGAKPIRPIVKLTDCLDAFAVNEEVEFFSPAVGAKTMGIKSSRLATMPEYLVIQMRKFHYSSSWVPTKIDVLIDAPDNLDIEKLRGHGLQPGETAMKDDAPAAAAEAEGPKINEDIVQMLMAMDIPRVRAERAVFNTQGQDADAAVGWLFSHLDDPGMCTFHLPTV